MNFILKYQAPIAEKFGLVCYGCCEGLHLGIDNILKVMPNIRRVSVSPWADQELMAATLGNKYVFSRKPNPSQIAVQFNEKAVREDIKTTLNTAGKLPLEIIMKDLHTIQNDLTRITRWVNIAREELTKFKRKGQSLRDCPFFLQLTTMKINVIILKIHLRGENYAKNSTFSRC